MSNKAQLAYMTTRLKCVTANGSHCGTGFFVELSDDPNNHVPVIVTARHVVEDTSSITFTVNDRDHPQDVPILGQFSTITWSWTDFPWIFHPDSSVDLAIAPFAELIHQATAQGVKFYFKKCPVQNIPSAADWATFDFCEDVLMIGYPEALWDNVHNMPLFRKGVSATHVGLPFCGQQEFLIDIACFGGSSGSPVFLHNEYMHTTFVRDQGHVIRTPRSLLVGIQVAGPQASMDAEVLIDNVVDRRYAARVGHMINLGYCIRADRLRDFLPLIPKN